MIKILDTMCKNVQNVSIKFLFSLSLQNDLLNYATMSE